MENTTAYKLWVDSQKHTKIQNIFYKKLFRQIQCIKYQYTYMYLILDITEIDKIIR